MKIFLLRHRLKGYDILRGCVAIAETAQQARKLVYDSCSGMECICHESREWETNDKDNEYKSVRKGENPKCVWITTASCVCIGEALPEAISEIVLYDFKAG